MANNSTGQSTLKKRTGGFHLSLAAKGLVILGVPLLFQMGFIGLLFYLHDRAEAYSIRAGNARNFNNALSQFSTSAYAAMYHIDDALWHHKPIDQAGLEEVQHFAENTQRLETTLHEQTLGNAIYAAIDPQDKEPFPVVLWQWLNQLASRKRIVDVPRTPFEMEVGRRADEMVVTCNSMVKAANEAAATPPDSAQHKQAFEQVQDLRHVLANGLRDVHLATGGVPLLSPQKIARDRELEFIILAVGCALNIALVLSMAFYFSRSIVQRLLIMLDNSIRLAMEKSLHPRLGGSDEIAKLDSSFHDMAEALTSALQKERALIENAQDVICSLDERGKFAAVNTAASKVFGYQPDELIDSNVLNLLPDDEAAVFLSKLKEVKAGVAEAFETRFIRRDRKVIDLLWSATWSKMDQTYFCVAHDITERKGAERLRQEVMQMVSHDLRTPLATMQNFHEMLKEGILGGLNEQGRVSLDAAERSTHRMLRLINDLLEIEKMEAGSLELSPQQCSLSAIFEQALQSVAPIANGKGVRLEFVPTSLTVYADPDRLIQILVNLLSNAVKFTAPEKKVTLSAEQLSNSVEIRVTDQGRGIPRAMQASIFDRFKQVQSADGKRGKGFGLGLAICKALVELHGGDISVSSEEMVGSVFSFRLPNRSTLKLPPEQPAQQAAWTGRFDR